MALGGGEAFTVLGFFGITAIAPRIFLLAPARLKSILAVVFFGRHAENCEQCLFALQFHMQGVNLFVWLKKTSVFSLLFWF
ncbi:MAG: hypothetical protein SWC96_09345 [Thermodesulfobacteriota bacterium]|nr:hypothetical protein [Thermodesulfobacteriota bacterium]